MAAPAATGSTAAPPGTGSPAAAAATPSFPRAGPARHDHRFPFARPHRLGLLRPRAERPPRSGLLPSRRERGEPAPEDPLRQPHRVAPLRQARLGHRPSREIRRHRHRASPRCSRLPGASDPLPSLAMRGSRLGALRRGPHHEGVGELDEGSAVQRPRQPANSHLASPENHPIFMVRCWLPEAASLEPRTTFQPMHTAPPCS